jgi:hypothetical protein
LDSPEEWQAIADVEGRRKKEEGKYIRYPTSSRSWVSR